MTAPIRSVLVANRGEIAVRVFRTLRSMGITSVAVFTDPDRGAVHARSADMAVHIGGPGAYLDVDKVVGAAVESGADALHPGYGFLSENPALADACSAAGVTFIGPSAESIRSMGDKINAKNLAAAAGVAVVPGVSGRDLSDEQLAQAALRIGLPVLLKPSAGGGGKGMRRVDSPDSMAESIAAAHREAVAAFGDGTLLVEKFVTRPRHVEVQVLADEHGAVVALGERECSLQRRHQKIIEETPSPVLDPGTRASMEASAVAVAKACRYSGAGTVEFILSAHDPGEFYFMEMNTRLQVEHPVTEMVRGLDLVEWQVRVAAGERLPWTEPPAPRGHAVEARVYAEDPANGFLPSTGTIRLLREPDGDGIRVDSALAVGNAVGVNYDPMLAKIVAWAPDREQALARLRAALDRTALGGLRTNIRFLRALLDDEDVVAGELDTGLVERVTPTLSGEPNAAGAAALAALILDARRHAGSNAGDPWLIADGWRIGRRAARRTRWLVVGGPGPEIEVAISGDPAVAATVSFGDRALQCRVAAVDGSAAMVETDGMLRSYLYAVEADTFWLSGPDGSWELAEVRYTIGADRERWAAGGPIASPMPGTVLAVHVSEGDAVRQGDALVTVEAMKMEHVVAAPADGTVAEILVNEKQAVALGQPLARVTPAEPQ